MVRAGLLVGRGDGCGTWERLSEGAQGARFPPPSAESEGSREA